MEKEKTKKMLRIRNGKNIDGAKSGSSITEEELKEITFWRTGKIGNGEETSRTQKYKGRKLKNLRALNNEEQIMLRCFAT